MWLTCNGTDVPNCSATYASRVPDFATPSLPTVARDPGLPALSGMVFSCAVVRESDAVVWSGLWRAVFRIRNVIMITSIASIGAALHRERRLGRDWRSI